jgi:hypothetical protein
MKSDLLTNATVVDDAIRFVSAKINLHVEQKKNSSKKITTKKNKIR